MLPDVVSLKNIRTKFYSSFAENLAYYVDKSYILREEGFTICRFVHL